MSTKQVTLVSDSEIKQRALDALQRKTQKNNLESWEKFRSTYQGNIDLSGMKFLGINFRGLDLSKIDFSKCKFDNCVFTNLNLQNINFSGARFITTSPLEAKAIENSIFVGATFYQCKVSQERQIKAQLASVQLHHARFDECDLNFVDFSGTKLCGVNFQRCNLTKSEWKGCEVDRKTFIIDPKFPLIDDISHDMLHDGTSEIVHQKLEKFASWPTFRVIGKVPLFGFSWISFIALLSYINMIGWLNETKLSKTLNYPIDVPSSIYIALISSVFLVIGTTIYSLACPRRIQEFSESEWVESLDHFRLLYTTEGYRRLGWSITSLLFLTLGGLIGLYLTCDRIASIFQYMAT